MSAENHQAATDILDQATSALRNAPASDVPQRFVNTTIAALHSHGSSHDAIQLQRKKERVFRISRYTGLAAALVLLAVATGVVMLWDRNATSAFAQIVENMKRTSSVSFALHLNLSSSQPPFNVKSLTEGKAYQQGDLMRSESRVDQNSADEPYHPLDSVIIGDLHTKQALILNPMNKTASKLDIHKVATINPVEALSTLADKDAKLIGEEELNGRKTRVFQLLQINFLTGGKTDKLKEGESGKLWVDAESGLPVKITAEMFSGSDHKHKISAILDGFVWNQPIDPKLFSMEIPDGFTITGAVLDEKALVPFAQVVENVKNAKSASFTFKSQVGQQPTAESKYYMQGDWLRVDVPGKQEAVDTNMPLFLTVVVDGKSKSILDLDYANKTARKRPMDEKSAEEYKNPMEYLCKLKDPDAEFIGDENLDGVKTKVYQIKRLHGFLGIDEEVAGKLWIDPQSELPVKLAIAAADGDTKILVTFDQFRWNEQFEKDFFNLTIPKGFKVSDKPLGAESPESK